jgi:glycosyltransferase involved in cell wall biosynthesis
MPARDEAPTVASNVAAALGCSYVREVIVVDDGSTDATADEAGAAGAKLVRREGSCGSKALAMAAGVAASDADAILFVDADCTGLTSAHLDAICEPFVDGRATMSIGAFDYGWFWNPMVVRWPPLSGERIIPRWVFESIPPQKLEGYTIEIRINEVIAEGRHPTTVQTMRGVSHRTKRDKHGTVEGYRRTYWMYRELLRMLRPVGDVRWRTYWFYLRNLTVLR